jgi:hypothetical protein
VTTSSFPPDTGIVVVQIRQGVDQVARFRFSGVGERSGYKCRLVSDSHPTPAFRLCSSGKGYRDLRPGRYTFQVRAVGSLGPDPTPAQYTFKVK